LTDTQILTLIIGITFPVLGIVGAIVALLYSNKRLDDVKAELIRHMDNGFEHMTLLLKLHEAEHHKH
jgi:flagellar motor component MotA